MQAKENLFHKGQRDANGQVICGAKTRGGTPCQRAPMPNGRCYQHGGKSLAGPASPSFKHGRYSKYLPKNLLPRYEESLADPDLLALNDEIAVVSARGMQLLERLKTGEGTSAWELVQAGYDLVVAGLREADAGKAQTGLAHIDDAIKRGAADREIWADFLAHIEQQRKLVDTERRLEEIKQQTMTVREVMTLVHALVDVVFRNVNDPKARAAIGVEVKGLLAGPEISLN